MTNAVPFATLALAAALLLRMVHPQRPGLAGVAATAFSWLALTPLALLVALPGATTPQRAAVGAALAIALLARDREDLAQGECALKLTWVLAAAFALSWAGESLLALAAGTVPSLEQWPALALQLDPYGLWSAALALTLLAGVVLVGGAPFHFWLADVFHGARAWLAPLVVASLQVAGAALLAHRLEGIGAFPAGAALVRGLITIAAAAALVGGAATLASQRRPERRVGTLASLQGALVLAALASDPGREPFAALAPGSLTAWGAHLALALTGAGTLARFLPVGAPAADAPAVLFRRHPWSGAVAAYSLLSLAGAPGTPGMLLWLSVARRLALTRHSGLLLALALAWIVAFAVTAEETRRAFGSPSPRPAPEADVPWPARAAMWTAAAGLVLLGWQWWVV